MEHSNENFFLFVLTDSNPDYLLRLLQFNLHFIHFLQINLFKIVARIPNFYFSSFFDKSH